MSKKLKCLSIFMAATVVTGLMGSNFAFAADNAEALENTTTTVVSSDDTYTAIEKNDSQKEVSEDNSYQIIASDDDSLEFVTKDSEDKVIIDDSFNKDDLVEMPSKDDNTVIEDGTYEVSADKPAADDNTESYGPGSIAIPGSGNPGNPGPGSTQKPPFIDSDTDEIDLTNENVWEADAENIDGRYVVINNLKFLLFSDSASIVKSDLESDAEDLVLPSMIKAGNNYYPVDCLSDNAFENCESLKSVVLSKHLEYVSAGAFVHNSTLETISLDPANDNLIYEDNVLFNKAKSELILYFDKSNTSYAVPEGVTKIGSYAFNTPSGTCPLTQIKLPESLKEIGMDTFSHSKIQNILIPANVEKMGFGAFSNCDNLKNAAFAEDSKLKTLTTCTFYQCDNLVNVSLPQNLEVIGNSAFKNCYSLKNVKLPQNLKTIDSGAFEGCSSLKDLQIPASATDIADDAF